MTLDEMKSLFAEEIERRKYGDTIPAATRRSGRTDLHAFLVLDKLVPASKMARIVASAQHDEIWLDVDVEALAKVVTPEIVRELVLCGVWFDGDYDSLAMFR